MAQGTSSVIWPDNYFTWPPEITTPHSEVVRSMQQCIAVLIQNGAERIYLPFNEPDTRETRQKFKAIFREEGLEHDELEPLCFRREQIQVAQFLLPLKNWIPSFLPHSTLNHLHNFLLSMLLANRVRAHLVDAWIFGPVGAILEIENVRDKVMDSSMRKVLDRLEGYIRVYAGRSLLQLKSKVPLTYADLRALMRTKEYRSLSCAYVELGKASSIDTSLNRIESCVRRLAASERFGHALKVAEITTSAVASAVSPAVAFLEFIFNRIRERDDVRFVPLFVDSQALLEDEKL